MIIENPDSKKAYEEYHQLIREMNTLTSSAGWKRIEEFMNNEMNVAYDQLFKAMTGDVSLKAAATFQTLKLIKDLPNKYLSSTILRLRQMDAEKGL